jgi:leucyl-tRNA synthetase
VLANEQVIDGRGWRTGALVEKREIPGYYLKITDYAEELLEHVARTAPARLARARAPDAGELDRQERGRALRLPARDPRATAGADRRRRLYVFTTRADTIMGVTFCAVAPEHPLAAHAAREPGKRGRLHRGMQGRRR